MNKVKKLKVGVNLTIANRGIFYGNAPSKLKNKRELVGYVPMAKRIADLKAAGIRTAAVRDERYFDDLVGDKAYDKFDIPPLPRHIPADLSEVADLAREYKARQAAIEEKVRQYMEARAVSPGVGPSAPREPAAETPVEPEGSK